MNARQAQAGLVTLQRLMLRATLEARSPAALLAVQRDLVTGARRLERACLAAGVTGPVLAEIRDYRRQAEQALARYAAQGPVRIGVRRPMGRPPCTG
jgi:hypothetical protein